MRHSQGMQVEASKYKKLNALASRMSFELVRVECSRAGTRQLTEMKKSPLI